MTSVARTLVSRDLLRAHAPTGRSAGPPVDAARLLGDWFGAPLLLAAGTAARLPEVLSELGIAGGAVYDALVGLAAVEHDASLATRDVRAKATYDIVGARVVVAA